MVALLGASGYGDATQIAEAATLRTRKDDAIRAFCATKTIHTYSSPLFLRRFLESRLSELGYDTGCLNHTLVLLSEQTHTTEHTSFLSILCTECRHHFHVKNEKKYSRPIDKNHPTHMLIPCHQTAKGNPDDNDFRYSDTRGYAQFICAAEECLFTVEILAMPPKLSPAQVNMLTDGDRVFRNLQVARIEDPQRYSDVPDEWATRSTARTMAQYLEDRLKSPIEKVLRIKKRNKTFRVFFGTDFDDLLRSLGFEERADDDDEECWYITEPEAAQSPTPVQTRRAYLQDTLEELRTLVPNSDTTPAWQKLLEAFHGNYPGLTLDHVTKSQISEADLALLGCLPEFSPQWFSWAAILLATLCPPRRDDFLDAGLRCILQRSEEASLNIIMYKSKFDPTPLADPQVQAAFNYFDTSPEDGRDTNWILTKYRSITQAGLSDSSKAQAYQHLEIIGNYLGVDLLGEVARGDSLALPSVGGNNRRMSIASASRLLKVDADFTAEMIRDFASNVDEQVDRDRVVEALEVLSELKRQQDLPMEATSLQEAADFLRATGNVAAGARGISSGAEPIAAVGPTAYFSTPPGLRNIGNTCYLNSLLQYFYNVKVVREMVLHYDQIQMDLDDKVISKRRTGGNGTAVSLEEAIVARQFTEELHRLFSELQTTTGAAAHPSQKLANTALSSAKEILTLQNQNNPPPLPARPSPAPPVASEDGATTVNVTVEPVNEQPDTASSRSSRTLVNEVDDALQEAHHNKDLAASERAGQPHLEGKKDLDPVKYVEDVTMQDPPAPTTLDEKIAQISRRLEQSDRSGTSQQDVEEIIGNILEHLMRAIRPDGPMDGKPDLQADKITKLFFTTIVNSTIKALVENPTDSFGGVVEEDVLNEEVVPERWITAFPHPDKENKVKSNLYEALDRYFSYELLSDGSLARYTTIRALPPIVHICIQRTDASGVKNKNPVIIPEDLYLDRYMEAETGSELWNVRRRVWAIKERVKELESRSSYKAEDVFKRSESHAWNAYAASQANDEQFVDDHELLDLNDELWRDIARPNKHKPTTAQLEQSTESKPSKRRSLFLDESNVNSKFTDILREAGQNMDEADSVELVDLRREEFNAFNSMKQHKYCLHAMICHGGGMNAGHYWVWVRDFKQQVWYKYNDSLVTEDSRDSQQVIDEVNNSGDPYYVAYVRDELKDELVEVPQRARRDNEDTLMNTGSDVEMEVIDSIVIDTPPQPANSPVNTPAQMAAMEDAPPYEIL